MIDLDSCIASYWLETFVRDVQKLWKNFFRGNILYKAEPAVYGIYVAVEAIWMSYSQNGHSRKMINS